MYHAQTITEKLSLLATILWPILVTQIGLYAMNLFDTMMSGRAGTVDLAGVAIGSSLWLPIFTGINGILMAVTPIVSQYIGSGKRGEISKTVTQALYLSIILALVVIMVGAIVLEPILRQMDLNPAVHYVAKHYLIGLSLGVLPLFAANVLRNFYDAQGHTRITMGITVLAIPINIVLNYGLIFGKFGLPSLGGIGTGYATAVTYWILFLISIWMTFKLEVMKGYKLFVLWFKPNLSAWKEQLSIGVPMGLSIFFESSIFAAVTLLIGMMFDTVTVAAHQAALNFTTLLFMVPLSISMALTILVGYEVGAKNFEDAKQYSLIGVSSAIFILAVSSIFLYLFREEIGYFYSTDRAVVDMTMKFLIFAIMYQLSDAAQASLQGVLRGYKDVTIPFFIALISYWLIGLPMGYFLASYTELGAFGYWMGITIGLTSAAIGFVIRLSMVQRQFRGLLSY